jgi:hypothetical protein
VDLGISSEIAFAILNDLNLVLIACIAELECVGKTLDVWLLIVSNKRQLSIRASIAH